MAYVLDPLGLSKKFQLTPDLAVLAGMGEKMKKNVKKKTKKNVKETELN